MRLPAKTIARPFRAATPRGCVKGRTTSRRGGFSLIELMLVGAVIAMMSVTVGVSIDTFVPKERLNTAVRKLTERLRAARSEAISRSLVYYVEYDLNEDRYRRLLPFSVNGGIFREGIDDDDERQNTNWEPLPPGVEFHTVAVAGDIQTDGFMYARFDARGAASDHQIVLTQPKYNNFFTVEILALTGTFKFHRGIYVREAPTDTDFN